MVDVNTSYPDFSAGELSPKMRGRHDLAAFYNGARRVENFITQVLGPAFFRNGTNYVAGTNGNVPAFLYTFQYTEEISYVLEFTEETIRFYANNGQVLDGGLPYEVTTPYQAEDLFQLKFAQTGVDLYIAHPSYAPQKLTYAGATSWTFAPHAAIQNTFGAAHVITGITQANPAVLTYTGSDDFSNGDLVRITGVNGMSELDEDFYTVANVNTGTNTFELQGVNSTGYSAYISGGIVRKVVQGNASFIGVNEYPACVGFYEQRLVYGGSNDAPNTLWLSVPADLDDFTVGTDVDSGLEYTIAGGANQLQWIRGTSKFLAVGAFGDIYQITGGIDGVITPTSISIKPTNSYGCASINPIGKGTQVFFAQSNKLILRSFEFDFAQDSYIPVDRNTVADHITKSGITQIEYQEGRPNILWCAKTNGELVGMTVEDGESVSGWHRHTTDGEVLSIATLPREGNYDQLWVNVKRNINGTDQYCIEYFNDYASLPLRDDYIDGEKEDDDAQWQNLLFEAQKQYIYTDCTLSYFGDTYATTTLTPSATTGTSVTFTAGASVFDAGMIGRQLWRKSVTGLEMGRAEITGYTSGTVVTCEVLESFNSTDAIPADEWYLTAGTVSGLDHLEGESVVVVSDGGQHPVATVSSGAITLDRQASVVHVGLAYKGYLESNDLEGGGVNGPAQTKKKNVTGIGIRFLDTLYAKYGTDYYNLVQIEMRTASMRMDRPPEVYTGDVKVTYPNVALDQREGGWSRSKRVVISQDQPFPCNVQLIVPYFTVSN